MPDIQSESITPLPEPDKGNIYIWNMPQEERFNFERRVLREKEILTDDEQKFLERPHPTFFHIYVKLLRPMFLYIESPIVTLGRFAFVYIGLFFYAYMTGVWYSDLVINLTGLMFFVSFLNWYSNWSRARAIKRTYKEVMQNLRNL